MSDVRARRPMVDARDAEEIATAALAYIAWTQPELDAFMAATGLTGATVREAARTPQFLAGVLDYVAENDGTLRAVCRALRIDETAIYAARAKLLPSARVTERAEPDAFGPGPLRLRCEHCGESRGVDRRAWSHVPGRVATVLVPRCGRCGGGLDTVETWLDTVGNDVVPW